MEIFQLKNKEGMIMTELKHLHFYQPLMDQWMDLGIEHQLILISQ